MRTYYSNNGKQNGKYCMLFWIECLGLEGPGDLVSRLILGNNWEYYVLYKGYEPTY